MLDPTGILTLDTTNLVADDGSVLPEISDSFGGLTDEALMTLHGCTTNELGNRGVQIRGAA